MVVPPGPNISAWHAAIMIYAWPSMIAYIVILLIIIVRRRKVNLFRTSYFTLTLYQSLADILTFLLVELVMHPRKFRFFGWNAIENSPEWFAAFSYVGSSALQSVVYFGYANIALSRYTILMHPTLHKKVWSHANIVKVVVSQWAISVALPTLVLLISGERITFVIRSNGTIGIDSYIFAMFDTTFAFMLNSAVLILCLILYRKTKLSLKSKTISSHLSIHELERQLFIFSIVTFVPLFVEMCRSSAMAYAVFTGNETLRLFCIDVWYILEEIVITMPMWTLVLASTEIRRELFKPLTSLICSKRTKHVGVIAY